MNSFVIILLVLWILAFSRRQGRPIDLRRFIMLFVGILLLHVAVIESLVAFHHLKHS